MPRACCTVKPVVISWGAFKNWLSAELHVSHAVLHIHVGMAVFVLSTIVLRKRFGSWTPVAIVAVLEGANETADFLRYQVSGWPWGPTGTLEDVIDTLLWPVLLTLLFRYRARRAAVSATGTPPPATP